MPKTNETRPSSSTENRIAIRRSRFRRGRACGGWMSGRSSSLICGRAGHAREAPQSDSLARGDAAAAAGPTGGESLALAPMPDATSAPRAENIRLAGDLARNAVDSLPERRARRQACAGRARGPAAARQARDRPDRARHPPRSRGRAAQAARVPGRRAPRRADHRRLHGPRGRPVRALEPAPDALGRADRGERGDLPGPGAADPRRRPRAPGGQAQRRMAGHADDRAARR